MNKKGIALIIIFSVIAVLATIGALLVSRSVNERSHASRYTESTQAFWLAEAGISQAVKDLRSSYDVFNDISKTALGRGGYNVSIAKNLADDSRNITAYGFIPFAAPYSNERVLKVVAKKVGTVPTGFYDNVLYACGNVSISGNSYEIDGNVRLAGNISDTAHISGNVTYDGNMTSLEPLDFTRLREISQSQGNYRNATQLDGPFPESFWYSPGVPNVVFMEGALDLRGKTKVGGFFVVGGEVIADATFSGNVAVDGCVYTLGDFTINGGGNVLNINGGVWSGGLASLNGNAKMDYNQTYMDSILGMDVNRHLEIISWKDTQNPYRLGP